jgi:hypothetical protein
MRQQRCSSLAVVVIHGMQSEIISQRGLNHAQFDWPVRLGVIPTTVNSCPSFSEEVAGAVPVFGRQSISENKRRTMRRPLPQSGTRHLFHNSNIQFDSHYKAQNAGQQAQKYTNKPRSTYGMGVMVGIGRTVD